MTPKIIAFYLPQYHPTSDNDKWWGKGFTEWTNVGQAKPLFPGHYQPKVPADLGYYDLRLPEIREAQAELAKEAGIYGFCYYHYWFEEGKEELDMPFKEVLRLKRPNFPFCLCWANESWHKKFWNQNGSIEKEMLIEQKYENDEVNRRHFFKLLEAFADERYIKLENKPIFMIYKPTDFSRINEFIELWNRLAKENHFEGIYFIAYTLNADKEYDKLKEMGFNAICSCRLGEYFESNSFWKKTMRYLKITCKIPRIYNYKKIYHKFVGELEKNKNDVFPTMIPNWDHTPRSGKGGYLYNKATPELFKLHAKMVLNTIIKKPDNSQICFLKSWNEWGEGNYMEPDMRYGKGFIKVLREALEES